MFPIALNKDFTLILWISTIFETEKLNNSIYNL